MMQLRPCLCKINVLLYNRPMCVFFKCLKIIGFMINMYVICKLDFSDPIPSGDDQSSKAQCTVGNLGWRRHVLTLFFHIIFKKYSYRPDILQFGPTPDGPLDQKLRNFWLIERIYLHSNLLVAWHVSPQGGAAWSLWDSTTTTTSQCRTNTHRNEPDQFCGVTQTGTSM